jgi:hypothetical protein
MKVPSVQIISFFGLLGSSPGKVNLSSKIGTLRNGLSLKILYCGYCSKGRWLSLDLITFIILRVFLKGELCRYMEGSGLIHTFVQNLGECRAFGQCP